MQRKTMARGNPASGLRFYGLGAELVLLKKRDQFIGAEVWQNEVFAALAADPKAGCERLSGESDHFIHLCAV